MSVPLTSRVCRLITSIQVFTTDFEVSTAIEYTTEFVVTTTTTTYETVSRKYENTIRMTLIHRSPTLLR